jgi:SnoaL-like domain
VGRLRGRDAQPADARTVDWRLVVDPAQGQEVADLISRFQRSFDDHDWSALESCLTPEIWVDYETLRGDPPQWQRSADYCARRRDALADLSMQHNYTNLVVRPTSDGRLSAQCNFQIFRFDPQSDRHFHSLGVYVFELVRSSGGEILIASIQQRVVQNLGDPGLHRGRT